MMEEEKDPMEEDLNQQQAREEIYSKAVRAGKRTYFFDVKATRQNDYYLTVTESKKKFGKTGRYYFEKHKIFLYKEDFEKFADALNETIDFIKSSNIQMASGHDEDETFTKSDTFTNVEFEDLGNK